MTAASAVSRSPRGASSAKSLRRCSSRIFSWWAWSAFHDWRAVSGKLFVIGFPRISSAPIAPSGDSPTGEPPDKRVLVVAGRQLVQFMDVDGPENVLGLERGDQTTDDVLDIAPPSHQPVLPQAPQSDVLLEGSVSVRQVTQLHRRCRRR